MHIYMYVCLLALALSQPGRGFWEPGVYVGQLAGSRRGCHCQRQGDVSCLLAELLTCLSQVPDPAVLGAGLTMCARHCAPTSFCILHSSSISDSAHAEAAESDSVHLLEGKICGSLGFLKAEAKFKCSAHLGKGSVGRSTVSAACLSFWTGTSHPFQKFEVSPHESHRS